MLKNGALGINAIGDIIRPIIGAVTGTAFEGYKFANEALRRGGELLENGGKFLEVFSTDGKKHQQALARSGALKSGAFGINAIGDIIRPIIGAVTGTVFEGYKFANEALRRGSELLEKGGKLLEVFSIDGNKHQQALARSGAFGIIDILKSVYASLGVGGEGVVSRVIGNYGKTQSYGAESFPQEGWINELLSTGGVSLAKRTDSRLEKLNQIVEKFSGENISNTLEKFAKIPVDSATPLLQDLSKNIKNGDVDYRVVFSDLSEKFFENTLEAGKKTASEIFSNIKNETSEWAEKLKDEVFGKLNLGNLLQSRLDGVASKNEGNN